MYKYNFSVLSNQEMNDGCWNSFKLNYVSKYKIVRYQNVYQALVLTTNGFITRHIF